MTYKAFFYALIHASYDVLRDANRLSFKTLLHPENRFEEFSERRTEMKYSLEKILILSSLALAIKSEKLGKFGM